MNQPSVRANLTPEYDYAVIAENFVKELRENRPRGISGLTMTATTTPALTDNKTLNEVVNCLTENIPLQTQGKCEQKNIFEILIRAATQKDSIENTTKVLKNVPTSNDIRYHLEKYSDLTLLEDALNKALQSRLPTDIRQGQQKIAIDFNLIPYYGEPSPLEAPYIYRSQAKNGTCSFYAYATVYVIKKHKRVTLAVKAVQQQQDLRNWHRRSLITGTVVLHS